MQDSDDNLLTLNSDNHDVEHATNPLKTIHEYNASKTKVLSSLSYFGKTADYQRFFASKSCNNHSTNKRSKNDAW